jgi:hypothetical protein
VEPTDHGECQRTLTGEHFGHPSPRSDESFEIAPGPGKLLKPGNDRRDRIRGENRKLPTLVRVDERCEGVELALLR